MTKTPRIAKARGRSVEEWIGKTPDSMPPPRVRLRIFDRHHGTCHISGRKIQAGGRWELEHIKRLDDGGENRESNLAPALASAHKAKTKAERADAAKSDSVRKRHVGITRPKGQIRSAGFAKTGKPQKIAKPPLGTLGRSEISRRFQNV